MFADTFDTIFWSMWTCKYGLHEHPISNNRLAFTQRHVNNWTKNHLNRFEMSIDLNVLIFKNNVTITVAPRIFVLSGFYTLLVLILGIDFVGDFCHKSIQKKKLL